MPKGEPKEGQATTEINLRLHFVTEKLIESDKNSPCASVSCDGKHIALAFEIFTITFNDSVTKGGPTVT